MFLGSSAVMALLLLIRGEDWQDRHCFSKCALRSSRTTWNPFRGSLTTPQVAATCPCHATFHINQCSAYAQADLPRIPFKGLESKTFGNHWARTAAKTWMPHLQKGGCHLLKWNGGNIPLLTPATVQQSYKGISEHNREIAVHLAWCHVIPDHPCKK